MHVLYQLYLHYKCFDTVTLYYEASQPLRPLLLHMPFADVHHHFLSIQSLLVLLEAIALLGLASFPRVPTLSWIVALSRVAALSREILPSTTGATLTNSGSDSEMFYIDVFSFIRIRHLVVWTVIPIPAGFSWLVIGAEIFGAEIVRVKLAKIAAAAAWIDRFFLGNSVNPLLFYWLLHAICSGLLSCLMRRLETMLSSWFDDYNDYQRSADATAYWRGHVIKWLE